MFEQFTDRARRVLVVAQNEAVASRHFIGGEHILIALARNGGIAQAALDETGHTAEAIRQAATRRHPPGPDISTADALSTIGIDAAAVAASIKESFPDGIVNVPSSDRPAFAVDGKEVLKNSLLESVALEAGFLGSEHLLLGLLATPKNNGLLALADLAIDTAALRTRVLEMISGANGR